jgi:hypothetical protein
MVGEYEIIFQTANSSCGCHNVLAFSSGQQNLPHSRPSVLVLNGDVESLSAAPVGSLRFLNAQPAGMLKPSVILHQFIGCSTAAKSDAFSQRQISIANG